MRKFFPVGCMALVLLLCAGCTRKAYFDYANVTVDMIGTDYYSPYSVSVSLFTDSRQLPYLDAPYYLAISEKPPYATGSYWWGLIPLVPFGQVSSDRPDEITDFIEARAFDFTPEPELRDAAYSSLKQSGLFSHIVGYTNDQEPTDYEFRGVLKKLHYRGRAFSYGLSIASPVLWLLACPYGSSTNTIGLAFELVDKESGEVVWTFEHESSDYFVQGLYRAGNYDCAHFASGMRRAMNAAIYNLSHELPAIDSRIKQRRLAEKLERESDEEAVTVEVKSLKDN